jgi:hypothetical protein
MRKNFIFLNPQSFNVSISVHCSKEATEISLSEGPMGGGREKENVREWKILKQPIFI